MCGIAGWIVTDAAAPEGAMASMLDAMAHRGPDDRGAYEFRSSEHTQHTALGHCRLSIISPQGAAQPMRDVNAGLTLCFNGEIYNFRMLRARLAREGFEFAQHSDTEVLLRAYQHWGADVVHFLRGSFAFAIWDEPRRRLLLARDRFGEKPLYLHEDGRNLYFASEIKALLRLPAIDRSPDLQSIWDYLAYRYVPGPATLFRGIRKLMPGTIAIWERGALTETRYWMPPDADRLEHPLIPEEPVAEFLDRLDEAVELQMVSDVPFGAFLSGGLDSSMIVALMSRHAPQVKTFSIGFHERRYSELGYAAEVARAYDTDHHELLISNEDLMERLESLVALRDAPVSEPSDVAMHMLACEAARSVKMVLTGEGSDELLGGYPKHVAERFVRPFQRLPGTLRRGLLDPLTRGLPYAYRRVKTAVTNLNIERWPERQVRWFGALGTAERSRLSVLSPPGPMDVPDRPPFDGDAGASPLRRILYFDQSSWLPDNLLERTDRMTMAASLEARVPFLDHELAAYVSALPDRYRVRGLCGKWILREAGKTLLPARILKRPKAGFRMPVNEWFRGPMRGYVCDHLRSASSRTRDYYDRRCLDETLDEHFAGVQNHEKLLWTLLNLELWHRAYA
jgi:asparagine synthase (glutamine-hydrolysing)